MSDTTAHQEDLLDQGLEDTFPASDPVSVVCLAAKDDHFPIGRPARRIAPALVSALGSVALAATGVALAHARVERRRARARRLGWAVAAALPAVSALAGAAVLAFRRRAAP